MLVTLFVTLCSPPGFSVHGILQARILEWVAVPSSMGSSWPRSQTHDSCLLHWQVGSLQLVPHGKPPTSKILYNLALAYLSDLISSHSLHFTHTVLISVSLRGKDPSHHRGLWSSYSSVMDATFQNFCTTDSLLKSTLSEILFFIMLAKVLPFPCLSYFILYVTYQHQKI